MLSETLTLPHGQLRPEAQVLGEALVATINAHLQRYPAMRWVEVQGVLRVLEQAATAAAQDE